MAEKKAWREVKPGYRWERRDGAVVKWDDSSPHPLPGRKGCRMFTAWEPDPSQRYLGMQRGRVRTAQDGRKVRPGFPRRWATPEAAMRAVDREYPIGGRSWSFSDHGDSEQEDRAADGAVR